MRLEYWAALGRAWGRMTGLLFRPFDPIKWLVLGFCAWVAGLLDGHGGGGVGGRGDHGDGRGGHVPADVAEGMRELLAAFHAGWEWVLGHWGATLLVFVGIPLLIGVILALVWVTSRFKLIFLDNLVRGRAQVAEPWRRLGALGDSLFLFRVGFGVAACAVGAILVGAGVGLGIFTGSSEGSGLGIVGLVAVGLLFLAFIIAVVYTALFLDSFVVPIMYRHNLPVMPAWRTFMPWLSTDGASFFLYGLFVLLLLIAAAVAIGAFGLATCCMGFLVLAIPYVGTVLLLPLLVTYRYLSLEFLAQLDPTLDVFVATQEKG
jgi:hypothetical protein